MRISNVKVAVIFEPHLHFSILPKWLVKEIIENAVILMLWFLHCFIFFFTNLLINHGLGTGRKVTLKRFWICKFIV